MTNSSSDIKKNDKYYVPPELKKMTKAIIPNNDTIPDKLKNITDKNTGLIPYEVDQKTISFVSSSLYSDYTACPREYMTNEARQVRKTIEIREKLLKKAKTKEEKDQISKDYKAELWVSLDGFARKLVIEGKNSMGMSVEDFDMIYRIIGRSGNFDGDESGQFGIGALSYLCLSDTLLFETWSRETNEKYILESKNGYAFEALPTDISTLETYGTKCTITINPDIDIGGLLVYIKKVGRFLRCPVYLRTSGNISGAFDLEPNAVKKLGHVDFKDHLFSTIDADNTNKYSYINIDNDDYELHGLVTDWDRWGSSQLLLLGIPINNDGINIPENFLINIKNERKYQPTSSRDGFSSQTTIAIKNRLGEDLKNFFKNIKFDTLDEIRNTQYKMFLRKLGTRRGIYSISELNQLVIFTNTCPDLVNLAEFLNQRVSVYTSTTLPFFGKSKTMTVLEVILLNKKIIYHTKHTSLAIYSVLNNDPDAVVIISKFIESIHVVDLLNKYQIEHIYDYIYNNNITIPKTRTDLGVYTYDIRGKKKIILPNNMDSNCIKIPKKHKLHQFLENLQYYDNLAHDNVFHDLMFCKETTKLTNTKAVSFDDIKNTLKNTSFNTSDGIMSGTQICKKYNYKSTILIHDVSTKEAKTYKDVITMEKCKKVRHADLVIFINDVVRNKKQIQYLLLYLFDNYIYNVDTKTPHFKNRILKTYDDSYIISDILNMTAVEHLGVDLIGSWYNKPNDAQKYLGKIKTPALRKLYARFVDSNTSWDVAHVSNIVNYNDRGVSISYIFSTLDKYYTSNPDKYKTDDDIYFNLLSREHSNRISNKGDKNVLLWLVATVVDEIFYPGITRTLFFDTHNKITPEFRVSHIKKYQKLLDEMYKRNIILNKLKITRDDSKKQASIIITFPANKLKHMKIDKYSQLHMVLWAGSEDRNRMDNDYIKSMFFDDMIHLIIPGDDDF